jgi:glutaredoxin
MSFFMSSMPSFSRWIAPLAVVVLVVGSTMAGAAENGSTRSAIHASSVQVTVYGAKWCGPCKILEQGLQERGIPFDIIDIDDNPGAWEFARKASGSNGIPVTSVARGPYFRWIIGANVNAVEQAYKGE